MINKKKVIRTNPKLWEKVKNEVLKGSKGGKKGQWSARKAQLAVKKYKDKGGKYHGMGVMMITGHTSEKAL